MLQELHNHKNMDTIYLGETFHKDLQWFHFFSPGFQWENEDVNKFHATAFVDASLE